MSVTPTAIDDDKPTTPFDYTTVPADVALHLQMSAERVRMRLKRSAEDIIEIGRELQTAKDKLRHGHFQEWLAAEFGMSQDSATNFMNVWRRFGMDNPKVSDYPTSALYLLAAPSTPEPVREAARKGEIPQNVKAVEQAIADAKEVARQARAEADVLQERLEMAEDEVHTRTRQQSEAQVQIDRLSDAIREMEAEVWKARNAKNLTPKTKEVRVEVPVVPPELEQELTDLKQQRDNLLRHAQELEAQHHEPRENTNRIHQKWQTTSATFAAAIRNLLADLPMPADTEQFDADDWQGLAELQAMVDRVTEELRMLRQPSMYIVEG